MFALKSTSPKSPKVKGPPLLANAAVFVVKVLEQQTWRKRLLLFDWETRLLRFLKWGHGNLFSKTQITYDNYEGYEVTDFNQISLRCSSVDDVYLKPMFLQEIPSIVEYLEKLSDIHNSLSSASEFAFIKIVDELSRSCLTAASQAGIMKSVLVWGEAFHNVWTVVVNRKLVFYKNRKSKNPLHAMIIDKNFKMKVDYQKLTISISFILGYVKEEGTYNALKDKYSLHVIAYDIEQCLLWEEAIKAMVLDDSFGFENTEHKFSKNDFDVSIAGSQNENEREHSRTENIISNRARRSERNVGKPVVEKVYMKAVDDILSLKGSPILSPIRKREVPMSPPRLPIALLKQLKLNDPERVLLDREVCSVGIQTIAENAQADNLQSHLFNISSESQQRTETEKEQLLQNSPRIETQAEMVLRLKTKTGRLPQLQLKVRPRQQ